MTHLRAFVLMVAATFLWSIAGVVTRNLHTAQSFEVTFWRSFFTACALGGVLAIRPLRRLARMNTLRDTQFSATLWISGVCWAVMFTAFMVALTLTTTAKVLVVLALGPFFTAIAARLWLADRLPLRTFGAIVAAGAGIAWMFSSGLSAGDWKGTGVALCVPLAAAVNWTVVQHGRARAQPIDLVPAVLIGAVISSLVTVVPAAPFAADAHDLVWLAILGSFQLALPCVLVVHCARVLPAPEVALLALLEVLFGIALAWIFAGEVPAARVLSGGALVVAALATNELLGLRARRKPANAADSSMPIS
jgi:drug/metabolite transporter (DMT)-like permease